MEGLIKLTNNLGQDSRCLCRDSKRVPL